MLQVVQEYEKETGETVDRTDHKGLLGLILILKDTC